MSSTVGLFYLLSILLIIVYRQFFIPKIMDDKAKKKLLRFAFVVIVLMLGCRHPFDTDVSDLTNYYYMFKNAIDYDTWQTYTKLYTVEQGYLMFNRLLAKVITWPQAIIFVHAIVTCYLTFDFIYRYADDVLLTLICFLSFGALLFYSTAFRQSFAISLCLYSLRFAEARKPIRFLLFVILATTMHKTAIVFVFAYFLLGLKPSKATAVLDAILIMVLVLSSKYLVGFGNEVLDMNYGNSGYVGTPLGGLINLAVALGVVVMMYFDMPQNYHKLKGKRGQKYLADLDEGANVTFEFYHLLIVGAGIYLMRFSALALERVSFYYFTPMLYILFPQVFNKHFKKENNQFLRMVVMFILIFLIFWRGREFGYAFFWDNEEVFVS